MSLINQMLQDLESRHALNEQSTLPNDVRPLPQVKNSPFAKIGGTIIGVIILGYGIYGLHLQIEKNNFSNLWPLNKFYFSSESNSFQSDLLKKKSFVPSNSITSPAKEKTQEPYSRFSLKPQQSSGVIYKTIEPSDYSLRMATVLNNNQTRLAAATTKEHTKSPVIEPPAPNEVVTHSISTEEHSAIDKKVRLTTNNERAESEYRQALASLNQGKVNEAITGFKLALKEDASYTNARQALAAILIEQRRLDEAESILQEGLTLNPAQPIAAIKLARIQIERGDNKAASETLQRSAFSGINNPDYRGFYAGVLQRLGDHNSAIKEYQTALRIAPQASIWWMGLGISFEAEGKMQEARDAFNRAHSGNNLSPELNQFVEQKLKQIKP